MRIKWFSLIRITGLLFGAFVPLLSNDLSWRILWGRCLFSLFRILITSLLLEEFGKARQIDLLGFFLRDGFTASCHLWCWWFWWPCLLLSWSRQDYVAGIGGCWSSRFYDQLLRNVNRGKLWIPVHSASLCSQLEPSCWGSLLYPLGLSGLVFIETFKI